MSHDDPTAPSPGTGPQEANPATPHPYSYVTIRFTAAEFEQIARAARAAGQTLPEFGHAALLAASPPA